MQHGEPADAGVEDADRAGAGRGGRRRGHGAHGRRRARRPAGPAAGDGGTARGGRGAWHARQPAFLPTLSIAFFSSSVTFLAIAAALGRVRRRDHDGGHHRRDEQDQRDVLDRPLPRLGRGAARAAASARRARGPSSGSPSSFLLESDCRYGQRVCGGSCDGERAGLCEESRTNACPDRDEHVAQRGGPRARQLRARPGRRAAGDCPASTSRSSRSRRAATPAPRATCGAATGASASTSSTRISASPPGPRSPCATRRGS